MLEGALLSNTTDDTRRDTTKLVDTSGVPTRIHLCCLHISVASATRYNCHLSQLVDNNR